MTIEYFKEDDFGGWIINLEQVAFIYQFSYMIQEIVLI